MKAYTQVSDDEVIVNFMDFETCFNDEYFAVPLELGIVQCAVKFDVVDSKIKFLHIRILDYLHCFFDPDGFLFFLFLKKILKTFFTQKKQNEQFIQVLD